MDNLRPDSEQVKRFFNIIHSDIADEVLISICTIRSTGGMQAKFFHPDGEDLLNYVLSASPRKDVWYNVCPFGRRPKWGRGSEADVRLVLGEWLDIDTEDGVHKKKGLPKYEEAVEFLKTLPWNPSLTVHSGGGVHVYYLFKEPQTIKCEADRVTLKSLSERFQKYVIARMNEKGWS
ncbi:MAG: hypothetical protein U5R49_12180 [Deltaproteobacteria bacterium]|nr:hypothetical protein [Deltaproteobacteria bacterium]